jgi:predicted AAA+ superfamily ATPase
LSYNLLDGGLRVRLLAEPTLIRQHVQAKNLRNCVIFIDEIQKCPGLLDEVHLLIEERGIRFLLTGSSVRTLKRAGTNLIERNMERGLRPPHYLSESPTVTLWMQVLIDTISGTN